MFKLPSLCLIGNKGVAVSVLQHLLKLKPSCCLHVGDQFLSAGNDIAARDSCPTIWITSPRETEKILEHILNYKLGLGKCRTLGKANDEGELSSLSAPSPSYGLKLRIPQQNKFDIYGHEETKDSNSDI